jgi:hypothetical protein
MIGEEAKKVLENSVGLPYEQLCGLNIREEIAIVKAKTGQSLKFIHDPRKVGRGNPLLAKGKITTMDEINKKIDALRT